MKSFDAIAANPQKIQNNKSHADSPKSSSLRSATTRSKLHLRDTDFQDVFYRFHTGRKALGTTNLAEHKCNNTGSQTTIPQPYKVTPKIKRMMTQACVSFCLYDCRPFRAVAGQGFQRVVETALFIGNLKGSHFDPVLLPHETSISRNVKVVQSNVLGHLSRILKPRMEVKHHIAALAMTGDFWKCKFTQRHCLGLTCCYIEHDWTYRNRVIGLVRWTTGVPKDARGIQTRFDSLLQDPYSIAKMIFTTDSGSDMSAAFSAVRCSCHRLNTILNDTFTHEQTPIHANVKHLIISCKSIITLGKKTEFSASLRLRVVKRAGIALYFCSSLSTRIPTK